MKFAHFEFDPDGDRLGEGPLSEVYKAVDLQLGRTVALKILRAHAEIDPKADTRFWREARHTSNLSHPNIATIYEYGQDQGTSYIAMEYLQGRTLDKIIKDQTLGFEECMRIASQLTSALSIVHKAGLVHRDLKPGNVMIQDDGNVKLLDFGIARATDEATITQHGMLVGTVLYMSPEQVRGEEIDLRSDIFALGSMLYQLTTNNLPFPGKSFPEVCMAILDEKPRRPSLVRSGMPPAFEDFIMRCLERQPEDRYQHAAEAHGVLLAITNALTGTNGSVNPASLRGTILIPPLSCGGADPTSCSNLAGSLRKDLATELARIKGLSIDLMEDDQLPSESEFDYVLRGLLAIEGPKGNFDLTIERYDKSEGGPQKLQDSWQETLVAEDQDEWGLQAALVRSAVRSLRRRLSDIALHPAENVQRDVEKAREIAMTAHEILHRGTSKHLMAAVSSFRRALEADPYCPLAFAGMAEALVRKYLYWDGETSFLDEARSQAQRALALDPRCAEAHTSLGFAYHLSGHPTDAQREYRAAIQLDNTEWLAHRLLGSILAREGNFKNASPLLQRAIALKPTHIGSYDHLFGVLQRLDRYEESLELADRGIAAAKAHLKEVKDNQEARTHMALLLGRMGLTDEAREVAKKAHELSPKDGYTSFKTACVYASLGEVEEAMNALQQATNRGFFMKSELVQNADLDVLRGLPEFQAMVS
jgi:serine/threonine protein kinase/Flp pilus assembly protein TadD